MAIAVSLPSIIQAEDFAGLLEQGAQLQKAARHEEALAIFRRLVEEAPDNPIKSEAQFRVAQCRYYLGDLLAASAEFGRVVEQYPTSIRAAEAARWQGDCYYFRRDLKSALATYEAAASKFSSSLETPLILYQTGQCHERLGNLSEARAAWEEILTRYPGTAWAKQAQHELKRLGRGR